MDCQKHVFQLDEGVHYLNFAYKSPLLKKAEEAARQALERERNPFRYKPDDFFARAQNIRNLFGQIVGCRGDEVALIPSVSYGLANAFNNINPRPGQHGITIQGAFPSDYFGIERWSKDNNAELRIIHESDQWNQDVLNAINEDTSVVAISEVYWMHGYQFDLEAIGRKCRSVGAYLVVDGTQSVGVLPTDVKSKNIDALVCASYKWMMGPYSTGLAYYGERLQKGKPIEESWMNRTNAAKFADLSNYDPVYKPAAHRYNVGEQSNFVLLPMMEAGLQQIIDWGVDNIGEYVEQLTRGFRSFLTENNMTTSDCGAPHLIGVRLPDAMDVESFIAKIKASGVIVSQRGQNLRASFHPLNDDSDVNALQNLLNNSHGG